MLIGIALKLLYLAWSCLTMKLSQKRLQTCKNEEFLAAKVLGMENQLNILVKLSYSTFTLKNS